VIGLPEQAGLTLEKSAGHGKLIYAMRVDRKTSLAEYCRNNATRLDAMRDVDVGGRSALISKHYFYFGRNAINISRLPARHLHHPFEKTGPGYRSDFTEAFITDFSAWLGSTFTLGRNGPPCKPLPEVDTTRFPARVQPKRCNRR
jgi:hypothetical protein